MTSGDRALGESSGLDALNEIYAVYEDFSKDLSVACKRGCCVCCTQDVTLTTLEGRRILTGLAFREDPARNQSALEAAKSHKLGRHPPISTNMFARLCLEGGDPPEESRDARRERCIFLSDGDCRIYPDRPFGCRSFFSTRLCRPEGSAVMDPFLLTVNSVFLQFLEEIDRGGFFGPMNAVLSFLTNRSAKTATPHGRGPAIETGLAPNVPIPALMIPPEHADRIQPIVRRLQTIREQFMANPEIS